ncbi:MAG: ABC transporter permease [Firmicutes bacterium]|nr:ABC transporter permease [Bacillota bacterium]
MKAFILLKKDIRTVLRNRRELIWMILVPLILLAANFYLQDQAMEIRVALVGDVSLLPTLEERIEEARASQIKLIIWPLREREAAKRLENGAIHAYLVVTPQAARMHVNVADTEGVVAQAIFAEVIRDSNQKLAEAALAAMVDDPASFLLPMDWQVVAAGRQVSSAGQLIFSSLFVIMGVMTALSLGQQSISMERHKNTLISLRKSPLTDRQIVWAKLGAALFSTFLPLVVIIILTTYLLPETFVMDPAFYLIILAVSFNSAALGVLIGAYVRGSNEGTGLRFLLTLPAMFLAAAPVSLPPWLEKITSVVPTLVSAQVVRSYFVAGYSPTFGPLAYLVLSGVVSMSLASSCLGREE